MYADTAAHPTLPLGSIVRVVNTRNHRSQIVRINDRGPYVEGRELDVSYEVARRLGFDQHGTAKVRLELLEVPARQRSRNAPTDRRPGLLTVSGRLWLWPVGYGASPACSKSAASFSPPKARALFKSSRALVLISSST